MVRPWSPNRRRRAGRNDGVAESRHVWRREVVRGALLFGTVVIVGLAGFRVARAVGSELVGLTRWLDALDPSTVAEEAWEPAFRWADVMRAGEQVYIRNTNGPITVVEAPGESLLVVADRAADPAGSGSVQIQAVRNAGGITFCALWGTDPGTCGPAGDYRLSEGARAGVPVRFMVAVPRGITVDASTVNGALTLERVPTPVTARTVNGEIEAVVRATPFDARTINGGIDVRLEPLPANPAGAISLAAVNGEIAADVAPGMGVNVEARTLAGRIDADLADLGTSSPRHVVGRIGSGGVPLRLRTVHGGIRVGVADTAPLDAESVTVPTGRQLSPLPALPRPPTPPEPTPSPRR